MSYIGKEPQYTDFLSKFFNGDGTAMTVTLDASPPNEAALLVFIDGVRQDTSAYTVSGYSLTFTGAVPSGTNNVQVVHLGIAQDTQVPVDGSVTSAKLDTNIAIDGDLTVDTDTLHVDSTNNRVGVGTASPSSVLHIKDNIPKVIIEDANNTTAGASYTPYIQFNAQEDNVGSVGFTQNGYSLDIKAENYNSASIRLFTGGSERMRIDSDGIKFNGDTASANALNDYEQGTWTPTLSASSGSNPTATTVNGDYTKIGNLVFIDFYVLNITAGNEPSAFIKVENLPFTVDLTSTVIPIYFDNTTLVSGRTMMVGDISSSEYILFRQCGSAIADTALDNAHINNGVSDIYGSGFYYTNQ